MSARRYPKPALLSQLPAFGPVLIEASAGTGKTYTLEHLVIELLLTRGASLDQLLIVTFTDKATLELRKRVREKLEQLADPAAAGWPAAAAQGADEAQSWLVDAAARGRLRAALEAFDRANLSTIHGFCQRALQEHALRSGQALNPELVDGREAFEAALRDTLRAGLRGSPEASALVQRWFSEGHSYDDLSTKLWKLQAVRGGLDPQPPGASAALAAWTALVDGWPDEAEGEALVQALAEKSRPKVTRILEAGRAALRRPAAGGAGCLANLAGLVEALRGASKTSSEDPAAYLQKMLAAGLAGKPALRGALQTLQGFPRLLPLVVHSLLPRVREALAQRKAELGRTDFDDLILRLRDALDGPQGGPLLAALRSRFRYALIDEFQDTDEAQWSIFRRIFGDSPAHQLFLIGDPKQAIYAFRGADLGTYAGARAEVLTQGQGREFSLDANFRASPALVAALNQFFAAGFFTADPLRSGPLSAKPVQAGRTSAALTAPGGGSLTPLLALEVQTTKEVSARVADEIAALLRPGARVSGPLSPKEIFVLCGSRRELARVATELRARRVPLSFYRQEGLFETAEAQQLADLLGALVDPTDPAARRKAWLTPFFGLSLAELPVGEVAPTHPLMARLFRFRQRAAEAPLSVVFAEILAESGIERRAAFSGQDERRLTNLLHLFETLLVESHQGAPDLPELLRRLRAFCSERARPAATDAGLQRIEAEADAVQLMTFHASKGLEAKVVFVAGGFGRGQQEFRRYRDAGGQLRAWVGSAAPASCAAEQLAEDERLLYVALTRARERLYLPLVADAAKLGGPYRVAHERLRALLDAGESPLIARAPGAPGEAPAAAGARAPDAARGLPPLPEDRSAQLGQALRARAGFEITSYSSLKQKRAASEPEEPAAREAKLGLDALHAEAARPDAGLPGGAEVGVFLHELLEKLPAAAARAAQTPEALLADPAVRARFLVSAQRHGIAARHLPEAAQLVLSALRTPLDLPSGPLQGLAWADEAVAELEFLFPLPERAHPRLAAFAQELRAGAAGATERPRFAAERGLVKGFIDLVFRAGDAHYIVDWKSDRLSSYAPSSLAAHVDAHYGLQVQLYSLAVARMLRLEGAADCQRRFGGVLYVFLREEGAIHLQTPRWAELQAWELDLLSKGAA